MSCKNDVRTAIKKIGENGGVSIEQKKWLDETLGQFSCFNELSASITKKENIIRNPTANNLFVALAMNANNDPTINEQFRLSVKNMIGIMDDYVHGGNDLDYEYASGIRGIFVSPFQMQEHSNGRVTYFSQMEFDQLSKLMPLVKEKAEEDYGNKLQIFKCKKCGWELGIQQRYGIYGSREVDACPNCTEGIRIEKSREEKSRDKFLIGNFEWFRIGGRPCPLRFDVKKEVPIPNEINYRPRDVQKNRLYHAQSDCGIFDDGIRFDDLNEVSEYVNDLIKTPEFIRNFGNIGRISVSSNGNCLTSEMSVEINHMKVSNYMKNEFNVLHELAHQITWDQPTYIKNNQASHGAWYAYTLIQLVKMQMGENTANKLMNAFDENKVQWRKGKALFDEMQSIL